MINCPLILLIILLQKDWFTVIVVKDHAFQIFEIEAWLLVGCFIMLDVSFEWKCYIFATALDTVGLNVVFVPNFSRHVYSVLQIAII